MASADQFNVTSSRRFSSPDVGQVEAMSDSMAQSLMPKMPVREPRVRRISTNSNQRMPYEMSLTVIPEARERGGSGSNNESSGANNSEATANDSMTISDPAPDGGYGWIIVLASFLCNLTVDGICYTFGLFFDDFVNHFNASKAITALAGSLLSGCYLTSGVFVSGLTNRFGCRPITIIGSLISCSAFLISTVAPNSYVLLFTYGIVAGIGFGLIYLPAIVAVGYYFTTKRALATGIAVCGSGMGAFLFAPLCQWLLSIFDWQNALMVLAGFILNCVVYGALMRPIDVDIRKSDEDLAKQNGDMTDSSKHMAVNTEPGVQSVVNLDKCQSNDEIKYQQIATCETNISREEHETVTNNYQRLPKKRTISLTAPKPPPLEEILAHDGLDGPDDDSRWLGSLPMMSKARRRTRSSYQTVVLPPLARNDVFYAGSTSNLSQRSTISLRSLRSLSKPNLRSTTSIVINNNYLDDPLLNKLTDEASTKSKNNLTSLFLLIKEILDFSLLKNPAMVLLSLSNIFGMAGYYIPFVYITQHVTQNVTDGLDPVTPQKAALLLSSIGISNVSGRIMFGWISDKITGNKKTLGVRITALTINNVCLLVSGVATIAIPWWTSYWLVMADCVLFGLFISSYMSLTSIILVDLLGLDNLSVSFGLISFFRGLATIAGPPMAGALYDVTGSFTMCFVVAGSLLVVSSLISFTVSKYEKIDTN